MIACAAILAGIGGCQKLAPAKPQTEASFCTPLLTPAELRQADADGHDAAAKARAPELGNSSTAAYEKLARDCLNRFARQYAGAGDPAPEIAKAAMAACATDVGFVTSEAHYAHMRGGMNPQLAQLISDQSKQKFADEAQRLVIEARAGHCAPPIAPSHPMLTDLRD